jgi:crotonobetainyl-CoA:carnitine CoA-transferase CaiB-like acyl-CoA transferase
VLIYNDKHWRAFFTAIGQAGKFESDHRFSTHTNRARHIDEVYAWVADLMHTRTTAEWQALLQQADIPNMPMNSPHDLVDDPHLTAVGFIGHQEHPTEGPLRTLGNPTSWSRSACVEPSPARRLGEDSADILRELGWSDAEIDDLVQSHGTATPT